MKKYLLSLLILSVSSIAYSNEGGRLDLKGITIGMTGNKVLKRTSCPSAIIEKVPKNMNSSGSYYFTCYKHLSKKNKETIERDFTHYSFDKNKNLILAQRVIMYHKGLRPEWRFIESDLINKYGQPNSMGYVRKKPENDPKYDNFRGDTFTRCWGKYCYVKNDRNGTVATTNHNRGNSLITSFHTSWLKDSSTKKYYGHYNLFITLRKYPESDSTKKTNKRGVDL